MASIYIHIPFCQSRCIYCDFYSTTDIARQEQYVECLEREMLLRKNEWPQHARTLSIYIGGGTPSTLPFTFLQRILKKVVQLFPIADDAEVTVEANPDDVTEEWASHLTETCVNRISMGVQTFHDTTLRMLRRRHSSDQARKAVQILKDAGYKNISIDLIYGLPGQTLEMWENDISEALKLQVPHISAYSLMYEEGTPLTQMLQKGIVEEMSDELSWRCYETLCTRLREAGYEHYEISNFALPGMYSRHNSAYWTGDPYLGFGAGAHSYDGQQTRRSNNGDLRAYLQCLSQEEGDCFYEIEHLSPRDLYNEFVMTRLRTSKGFNMEDILARFGTKAYEYCMQMAQPHLLQGNLKRVEKQICLTKEGIFISNDVISDLFI